MEAEIQEYKADIEEYKNCPIPQCFFRVRRLQRDQAEAIPNGIKI